MGGKPCIRGMRVTVGMIVEAIAAGRAVDELLTDFPYLQAEDIREALTFAAGLANAEAIYTARDWVAYASGSVSELAVLMWRSRPINASLTPIKAAKTFPA